MGGGAGVSVPGRFRVATEKSVLPLLEVDFILLSSFPFIFDLCHILWHLLEICLFMSSLMECSNIWMFQWNSTSQIRAKPSKLYIFMSFSWYLGFALKITDNPFSNLMLVDVIPEISCPTYSYVCLPVGFCYARNSFGILSWYRCLLLFIKTSRILW